MRRTYIPKKNGKLRPLGIPSFDDKLIQEIAREILEAIYEPIFSRIQAGKSEEAKEICSILRRMPSYDMADPDYRGVRYVRYGDEIRELYYYYCPAGNVSKQLYRFQYLHYSSLAMTIAAKHKLSLRQTLNKFAIDVRRKQGTGTHRKIGVTYTTKKGTTVLTYFNEPIRRIACPPRSLIEHYESHFNYKNELIRRLAHGQCEMCGYRQSVDNIEVHHIRKLKGLKDKFNDPSRTPVWVRTIINNRRKTLILCRACHKDIHKKYNRFR